jgi:hypothetical protein
LKTLSTAENAMLMREPAALPVVDLSLRWLQMPAAAMIATIFQGILLPFRERP